jgi:hypothetical protein
LLVVELVVVVLRFGEMELPVTQTPEHNKVEVTVVTVLAGLVTELVVEPVVVVTPVVLVELVLTIAGAQVVRVVLQVSHTQLLHLQ